MADPLIQLINVSKSFGGETVLKGINISIEEGESIVLVGPSGSGKSSLLKIMAGIIRPDHGAVCVSGQNILTMRKNERLAVARQMGMLFQRNALFDSLTCAENIRFPLKETTLLANEEIEERVLSYLVAVGLPHAKALYPDEISGGMQKRLGIARALALDPKIVFYDDPTAGLDPITSRMIMQLILKLKKEQGSTIITVTNDMNRAYQLAGRIYLVAENSLIEAGDSDSTRQHSDPRVKQFIHGQLVGPLTEAN